MDRKNSTDFRDADAERYVARTPAFSPVLSWSPKLDHEEKDKHEFSLLLMVFRYAVERADQNEYQSGRGG